MPAGYSSGNPSILDTIVRTYKNGAGDVIATQYISVQLRYIDGLDSNGMALVNDESSTTSRFRRTGKPVLRTVRSPKSGASAVIASVVTEGSYNTRSESGNDVVSVTYTGNSSEVNDLTIPVNALSGVFKIGDTI